jgi:4-amino-4-deoxy-L-arabinose transferase-like glycosyltransferase
MNPTERDDGPVSGRSADEPFPFQTQLFTVLMLVSVALRLWILIVSRHYLRSDEAVTAMEALDIMEGGPIPIFHYGQAYGGGHTIEALMAIPWFAVFGPSDYLFKLGPALLSCVYIWLVYLTLYRFFNKRYALIAAAVFAFFAPFVAFSFYNNGGSVTTLFGWLGLYLFFRSYFAESEKRWSVMLAGASLGFAYYCFDYALYYLVAVIALWILKYNIHLWKRWRCLVLLLLGFFIGASPLIYFNLTHEFANFKHVLFAVVRPNSTRALGPFARFAGLFSHDLPAFFSLDVEDFPAEISPISYFSYGLFLIAMLYVFVRLAPAAVAMFRSFFARKTAVSVDEQRIVYLVFLIILYIAIYSVSNVGGNVPRYLIVLCPLIPMMLAWAAYDLGRRRLIPAVLFLTLFAILQIPFLVQFARDDTILEWDVRTHGEDMKTLAKFLLDNNLTTVVTPYEIKWKLMFESQGKIVCAAYLFGFDRDPKYNLEVVDRVNRRKMPVAFVFDKEYKLPQVALKINPEGAFDLDAFHAFLKRGQITYQITPVGQDYVVYHGFSKPLSLIAH